MIWARSAGAGEGLRGVGSAATRYSLPVSLVYGREAFAGTLVECNANTERQL